MIDLILELVFDVVSVVLEVFLEDYASSDIVANRIFWGFVIAATVGVIWWELH
jgi:hypothetical protein